MPESKSRFVLACQQMFAFAVVAAVAVSATGVVELEIVSPHHAAPARALGSREVSLVSSAPVKPTVRNVPFGGGATAARSTLPSESGTGSTDLQVIRVVSAVEPVTGFATVGVTWATGQRLGATDVFIDVRTEDNGVWSEWQQVNYDPDHDPDHDPDPGTEGPGVKSGTDAMVVGDVDAVQARATTNTGYAPKDLSLAIVDPGKDVAPVEEAPAIDTGALESSDSSDSSSTDGTTGSTGTAPTYGDAASLSAALPADRMAVAPRPQIYSRAQWGADERLRDPSSLHYGKIETSFVHHTVNANDYTKDQVPSILRGIYAYHTQSRGWSDIGYNFLVDRFGRIWEGRYGGVDKPVVGAHTVGYNEESFAMSAIGNYEIAQPSQAMINAYAALFAWKLSLAGIAADDPKIWVQDRYLQAINGHRDADQTACPGKYLYAKLPEIRKLAAAIQQGAPTSEPPPPSGPGTPLNANISGSDWPDLVVRDAQTHDAIVVRTLGQMGFDDGVSAATKWSGKDLVAPAGDLDGDKVGDLMARTASTGETTLYLGTVDGTLRPTDTVYHRFAGLDQLTGAGDFDGRGNNDLIGRDADSGRLLLFPGRGDGSFGKAVRLSDDWSSYDLTAGVDDLDGDGHPDLVARSGDALFLVPGLGSGSGTTLGRPVPLKGSWGGFDAIAGRGDVTSDGIPDVVARDAVSGVTYVYPGDGQGGFTSRLGGWSKYRGLSWLAIAGQLAGSRRPDLVAVNSRGELRVFPNTGRRNVGSPIDTGVVLDDVDLLLNVGDWDGDGRGDVMTRQASTGVLQLRRGLKGNRLAAPVTAGTGWDSVTRIAAVGDVTGDGNPDLVGRAADGSDRVYPGNGSTGFGTSFLARSDKVPGKAQVTVGFWDDDEIPDSALRRTDGTLWTWLSAKSSAEEVATGLRRYDWVRGLGDVDGDGRADLVVRSRTSGSLYLLPGRTTGFAPRRLMATGFGGYDLAG